MQPASLSNTTITLFGGSGFLGRSIVKRLAATSATLRIASRRPNECLRLKTAGVVGQIVPVPYHPQDAASIRAAIGDATVVINCIGILYERGRQTFQAVHVELAERIAAAAHAAGVQRFIQLSAIGADAVSPAAYGRSKAQGEAAVRAAFPRTTVLRPSVVFGADDGFLNLFATLAKFLPALPLIGGGHTKFQPVYVGDVAAAVLACLEQPKTIGKIYELGGPGIYSFRQLLEFLLATTGQRAALVPLPFGLAKLQASVLQLLPKPLLTLDQVRLLQRDNVVSAQALTMADLGIRPQALEVVAPTYLRRFRPGGMIAA